jgi:SanA protein
LLSGKIKLKLPKGKIHLKVLKWILLLGFIAVIISNLIVEFVTRDCLFSCIDSLPANKVGLLLGTSKYKVGGGINPYYEYRIMACVELYKSGKIKYIIASGDNRKIEYNEPMQMRDDLIKNGVDTGVIFLDYAGFRTLDSVVRSREIFGQSSITIISQAFHNKRAVFIANSRGIKAVGYNAQDVKPIYGLKVQVREIFARVKLMIDLFIINKQPKYLGEKVIISMV